MIAAFFTVRAARQEGAGLDSAEPKLGGSALVVVKDGGILRGAPFLFPDVVGGEVENQVFGFSFIDVDHNLTFQKCLINYLLNFIVL